MDYLNNPLTTLGRSTCMGDKKIEEVLIDKPPIPHHCGILSASKVLKFQGPFEELIKGNLAASEIEHLPFWSLLSTYFIPTKIG